MMYSKDDMRQLLLDAAYVSPDAIDIAIRLVGDTNETYKKILTIATPYKTFMELEEYWLNEIAKNEEAESEYYDDEGEVNIDGQTDSV